MLSRIWLRLMLRLQEIRDSEEGMEILQVALWAAAVVLIVGGIASLFGDAISAFFKNNVLSFLR
jgi:hypothetical protein